MEKLNTFLRELGLHPDCVSLPESLENFRREMAAGLCGRPRSLGMHPTFLAAAPPPENSPTVLCLDCGGTRFRLGLVRFSAGRPEISDYREAPMPGTGAVLTAPEFFDQLAALLRPLAQPGRPIGFCFSYPMDILPDRDGRLLRLTKELKVPDLPGHILGHALLERLPAGCGPAVLLNDTTATLLGGLPQTLAAGADGLAGMILGTGFNCCYAARGAEIAKLPGAPDMIVNLECGNYTQPQGAIDRLLDTETDDPGAGTLEKMLGGAYHPRLIHTAAAACAKAGFFTRTAADALAETPSLRAQDLEELSLGRGPLMLCFPRTEDRNVLLEILRLGQARAARLAAMVLTALAVQADGGRDPVHPFCAVVDGSAFHGSHFLQAALQETLETYSAAVLGRHIRLLRAPHSNLLGAASAASRALTDR